LQIGQEFGVVFEDPSAPVRTTPNAYGLPVKRGMTAAKSKGAIARIRPPVPFNRSRSEPIIERAWCLFLRSNFAVGETRVFPRAPLALILQRSKGFDAK
jgi:hypothetical protein